MMNNKALIFNKPLIAKKILILKTPSEQKYEARAIKASNAEYKEWEKVKYSVVVEGNLAKFGVGYSTAVREELGKLRKRLLETGGRELVEAAKNDRTWGIGFDEEIAENHREQWGQNLLGKALMEVRERMRAEEET